VNTIIVALGGGKFKPVQIELGAYSNGFYQVLSGLKAGVRIVTSAQFLIDSESNLNAALSGFIPSKTNKNAKSKQANVKKEKKDMKGMDMSKPAGKKVEMNNKKKSEPTKKGSR